jgi:acetyltransferase-like isoleucine patch superfamily enzyme
MISKNLFHPEDYYYNSSELRKGRFKAIGKNVLIAKNCTIVGEENISIENNVRIDGFCTIIATGFLKLGSFIHIGSYCHFSAGDGITVEDFSGISQGTYIYSRTDDFSGDFLTGPTIPSEYTNVIRGTVVVKRHAIIGARSVILPKVIIGEGCAVGALSLVQNSLEEWGIYAGCPAKRIKDRSRKLLVLEKEMLKKFDKK